MTGCAIIGIDTQMVEADTGKAVEIAGRVTGRTIQSRRYVIQCFPKRDITVMALRAIAGIDTHVAKRRWSKGGGVVAVDAILVIGIGRYVIRQLTDTDYIVVARRTVAHDTGMIIGARAEGPRRVTDLAILTEGRHMLVERRAQRYTGRINTVMTVIATLRQNSRIRVIDAKCRDKALGGMARTTIGRSCRVSRYRGRFGRCTNTGVVVVAPFARLHRGVNHAVVENSTGQFERHNAVAGIAIERRVRLRVSNRIPLSRTRAIGNMAGTTRHTCYVRAGVVGIGIQETDRGMAETAFRVGVGVGAALADGWRHTSGYRTVVATCTDSGDIRMIETAVGF